MGLFFIMRPLLTYTYCTLLILFYSFTISKANNVTIKQVTLIDSTHLSFKISWEHSWHLPDSQPPGNHDAVWCFIKYQPYQSSWQHLYLNKQSSKHYAQDSSLLKVEASPRQTGVLIRRHTNGTGSIDQKTITVKLAQPLSPDFYKIQVHGIEMVHIPSDSFYIGDIRSNNTFHRGNDSLPYHITAPQSISVGQDSTDLSGQGTYAPDTTIPQPYPKGYEGLYCMKYEITQSQYRDFLNTLTYQQQAQRTAVAPNSSPNTNALTTGSKNRNGIIIASPGQKDDQPARYACNATNDSTYNQTDDGQNRACNYLKWADLAAYLDWAGLRPMTEMEYEKISRGPKYPVKLEFSWGTPYIKDANDVQNDGTPYETVSEKARGDTGVASHGYSGPSGPLRNGFNGTDTSGRLQSGSSYYGVKEMSGNVWELAVTVNQSGLQFEGKCGDGKLTASGETTRANWPQKDGKGAGYRGGAWNSGILTGFRDLAISDRFYAGDPPDTRLNTAGGRGLLNITP